MDPYARCADRGTVDETILLPGSFTGRCTDGAVLAVRFVVSYERAGCVDTLPKPCRFRRLINVLFVHDVFRVLTTRDCT